VEDVEGSEIIVVCASAPHPQPFNDRRSLTLAHAELMRSLLPEIAKAAPQAKLIMVSNPVDSLTWLGLELTGFPPQRVVGTGTLVDSFRYRDLLSKEIGIHPGDLRVYILGEHGESQVPAMSIAMAGGERIRDDPERRRLAQRAKQAGLKVFQGKGNTCYAIAQATALIIRAIIQDERATIPVSVCVDDYLGVRGLCLSLPAVIGSCGVVRILHPELSLEEQAAFAASAESVAETNAMIRSGKGC
jgi:L-lactate dehydrogenase